VFKVQILEKENKMLETKWKLLQSQTSTSSQIEPMLKAYIANLQRQLDVIGKDKQRLQADSSEMHHQVDDYKTKLDICVREPEMMFLAYNKKGLTDEMCTSNVISVAVSGMRKRSTKGVMQRMSLSCSKR